MQKGQNTFNWEEGSGVMGADEDSSPCTLQSFNHETTTGHFISQDDTTYEVIEKSVPFDPFSVAARGQLKNSLGHALIAATLIK